MVNQASKGPFAHLHILTPPSDVDASTPYYSDEYGNPTRDVFYTFHLTEPAFVTLSTEGGNESSCVPTVNVNVVVGIDDIPTSLEANVHPNPFSTTLILDVQNSTWRGPVRVQIFNLHGQAVYQTSLTLDSQTQVLNLGHLSSGSYIVRLVDIYSTLEMKVTKM